MRHLLLAALLLALPLAATAQTPLTAAEFEAYVTGKTLTYQSPGSVFGTEEYLPGRKVRWSETPTDCPVGRWYPEGRNICFLYEDDPEPACWSYWLQGATLLAAPAGSDPEADPYEVVASARPLSCPNPQVGN
jgi:hypothetical protein